MTCIVFNTDIFLLKTRLSISVTLWQVDVIRMNPGTPNVPISAWMMTFLLELYRNIWREGYSSRLLTEFDSAWMPLKDDYPCHSSSIPHLIQGQSAELHEKDRICNNRIIISLPLLCVTQKINWCLSFFSMPSLFELLTPQVSIHSSNENLLLMRMPDSPAAETCNDS